MEVVEREGYYYLRYSYRKGKRVLTKDKYLGNEIPKNIEEIKKRFMDEIKREVYDKFEIIKLNYQKEWKRYPESMKKKVLKDLDINFTYNTNAIEGSTITLEETEDIIKNEIAPNKSLRDIKETVNHSKVFLGILNEKDDLSEGMILKWHKELFFETKEDIAGKYRDYLVRVGGYRAPDWQDVKKLMKEMIKWYKKNKKKNPVELSAVMHYKFEKIHPFGDGNGRVGRLISNFILNKGNYPMLVIEYKKRKTYYSALDRGEEGFVKYYFRRYLKVYGEYLD